MQQFSSFFNGLERNRDDDSDSDENRRRRLSSSNWLSLETENIDIQAKVKEKTLIHESGEITSQNIRRELGKVKKRTSSTFIGHEKREDTKTENKEEFSSVDVAISADFLVKGTKKKDVADLTENLTNHLALYLKQVSSVAHWQGYDPNESEKQRHHEFQNNIRNLLQSPGSRNQGSLVLLDEFSSAQDLLAEGVEKYVEAVHSVLKTDLDESISVLIENLTYKAVKPKLDPVSKHNTVSSVIYTVSCGLCLLGKKAFNNILNREPPIQFEETIILDNITAHIDPGKLTLVLGPPGCGKTSLLKAIAGHYRKKSSFTSLIDGTIKLNGKNIKDLKNLAAWVSYTSQNDEHQPLLTVKETLDFAFKCRKSAMYADEQILALVEQFSGTEAVEKLLMLKDLEVDIALALLGLTNCKDTIIGHENLKGVSGGEKRRVTLGEMLVTGSQIMCCDEISTGLDSAATFDIVAYLRSAAHVLRKSILVALLQPPPEVIGLFDNVLVLAEGRIIFHGSTEQVVPYFSQLGYKMIEGKDIGDFIVELPTRNGIDYLMNRAELDARGIDLSDIPKTPLDFAAAWKSSTMFEAETLRIDKKKGEYVSMSNTNYFDYDDMPVRGFFYGLWHTVVWSWTLRMRDKIQIFARIIANLATGFFFGTLFWQLSLSDWWLKAMLFLMALMFIVSTSFPSVQIISKQKEIFMKHIAAKFYSPTQFCIAQFIVAIPFVAFDTAVFGSALYWMCGLAPHLNPFLIFIVVCVTFGIAMNSVMQFFPFVTPTEDTAIVAAALFLILSVTASTALSTESMTPYFFRWTIWINPLAWSYRALAINEYETPEYHHSPCKFDLVGINITVFRNCSDYFLEVREVRKDPNYVWGAIVFNIIVALLMLLLQIYAVSYIRFQKSRAGVGVVPQHYREGKKERKGSARKYLDELYLSAVTSNPPEELDSSKSAFPFSLASFKKTIQRYSTSPRELEEPLIPDNSSTSEFDLETEALMALPKVPQKTLIIKNLWYSIPIDNEPVDFLKDVSFVAKPARLMGLMGSSGAGKTTLMDVISGRKTVGYARGDILINGILKDNKNHTDFVKYAAYVEQFGVHADCATIRESLQFSAALRLNYEVYKKENSEDATLSRREFYRMKQNLVESVLQVLELDDIADELAGQLSMEQNKRLTLGVELVANPSIIFCDEPTSGLDARAAAIVMKVLAKTAKLGRTVICTVHQPSTAIFNFFDDLLLLKRGGEIVFAGEIGKNSSRLIDYFNSIPGTKPYNRGMNPATWMLEVIGAGTDMRTANNVDYAMFYNSSKVKKEVTRDIRSTLKRFHSNTSSVLENKSSFRRLSTFSTPYRDFEESNKLEFKLFDKFYNKTSLASEATQMWLLLKRNLKTYWRSPEFSLNRLIVVMLFTLIFSIYFYDSHLETVSDIEGRIVNIFFFTTLTCIYNLYTLVPFALSRRALFYRERAQGMYSVFSFTLAEGFVEIPWIIVQVLTTLPFLYYLTNLSTVTSLPLIYFFISLILSLILMTSLGLLAASLFPDPLAAQLAAVFIVIVMMVFCGIMVPLDRLPKAYVPLYYVSFFKYIAEGLMTTQFHNINKDVCIPEGMPWNETRPTVIIDTLHWLHTHVSKDFPENFCTQDGNLEIDIFDLQKTLKSIKNVTGVLLPAEDFVLGEFMKDYDFEKRYLDLVVLTIWIVGLRVLTFLVMANVNHQKR